MKQKSRTIEKKVTERSQNGFLLPETSLRDRIRREKVASGTFERVEKA
jgi:hypothetical protein